MGGSRVVILIFYVFQRIKTSVVHLHGACKRHAGAPTSFRDFSQHMFFPCCLHFWERKTVKSLKLSSKMRLSCFSLRITICLPFEVPLPHVAGLRYHKIAFEMPPGAAPKMPFCCFLRRPRSARVHVVGHRLLHGLNITFGGSQVSNLRGSWGPFGGPSGAKMGEDL